MKWSEAFRILEEYPHNVWAEHDEIGVAFEDYRMVSPKDIIALEKFGFTFDPELEVIIKYV